MGQYQYLKFDNQGYIIIDGKPDCDYVLRCKADKFQVVTDYTTDSKTNSISSLKTRWIDRNRRKASNHFGTMPDDPDASGYCNTGNYVKAYLTNQKKTKRTLRYETLCDTQEQTMKNVLLILTLFITILSSGGLPKGEHRFKSLNSYKLNDFHFAKPVTYMDIASFQTEPSDGTTFKLPKNYTFYTKLKVGELSISESRKKHAFDYLAHAILKRDYFWKAAWPPAFIYNFTTLRFMEAQDKRLKAVTEPKDILDLFGTIDTIAELHVWLEAIYALKEPVRPYSWEKTGTLYRVRYKGLNPFSCEYHEYFEFFNTHGDKVKTKILRHYHKKQCEVIMP